MGFLRGVREGWADISHMPLLAISETQPLFEAFVSFLRGEFLDSDHVDIHGIRVLGCFRGGEGLEGLGRPSTSLGNLLCMVPLVLKVDGFGVPVVDFVWYGVKGHDPLHEQSGDSGDKEADEDIVVSDASMGGVTLKRRDITLEGGGELSVLLGHAMGG